MLTASAVIDTEPDSSPTVSLPKNSRTLQAIPIKLLALPQAVRSWGAEVALWPCSSLRTSHFVMPVCSFRFLIDRVLQGGI